jgi:hypothetical protein
VEDEEDDGEEDRRKDKEEEREIDLTRLQTFINRE